jgi:hypothetical protein
MPFELKVIAIGFICALVGKLMIDAVGEFPGLVIGLPLLVLTFGGMIGVVVGLVLAVINA